MPRKKTKEINTKRSLLAKGYYSDCRKANMLHAAIVRSPTVTGRVTGISIPNLPEGYFLYTAKDIPGKKQIKENNVLMNIFSNSSISYTGEPLGIVVGPEEYKVKELRDSANISFDISDLESALDKVIHKSKTPIVSTDITDLVSTFNELPSLDNVIDSKRFEKITEQEIALRKITTGKFKKQDYSEILQSFSNKEDSEEVIEIKGTFQQKVSNPKWLETDGAFAYYENGELHVYTPTKWTYSVQKTLSECLDIPTERIYVHKTISSGLNANGLWRTTQLAIQTAVAAILSKHPVKLMLSQTEQQKFMSPNIETEFSFNTIVSKSGLIKASKININVDVGINNPFAQEIADRLSIGICNYYKLNNLSITTKVVTSQNPPTSIFIRRIDSEAFFAIENHFHQIATELNILPEELRKINKSQKTTDFPFELELPDTEAVIQNTIKVSDFNRKYSAFKMDAMNRLKKGSNPFFAIPLRGMGIATAYNSSNYLGTSVFTYNPKIEVTLFNDENVEIHALQASPVIQNIWKETASDILQLPKENIKIVSEFEIEDFPTSPENYYSSVGILNDLIKKCCTDIQKKRFHQPLPITSKKSVSAAKKNWNNETFSGNPFTATSFASTAVEVQLDSFTYTATIKGIWITIDCGEIFDEVAAKRAIMLHIQQELTTLVKGATINCNKFSINFIQSNNKTGQIGELVHNTLPAAFAAALSMALQTQLSVLPCTEEQIYNLIQAREIEKEKELGSEEAAENENKKEFGE
ncbi:MAG: xanthine dehydrogenase family protein [Treponema bryantii]|nr:xanthine dehydrogenase family protein [Treponema bryantii]